jgi:hypothetical protein
VSGPYHPRHPLQGVGRAGSQALSAPSRKVSCADQGRQAMPRGKPKWHGQVQVAWGVFDGSRVDRGQDEGGFELAEGSSPSQWSSAFKVNTCARHGNREPSRKCNPKTASRWRSDHAAELSASVRRTSDISELRAANELDLEMYAASRLPWALATSPKWKAIIYLTNPQDRRKIGLVIGERRVCRSFRPAVSGCR